MIKGLLERREKYPSEKNFKSLLNSLLGEYIVQNKKEIASEYEKTLNGKVVIKETVQKDNEQLPEI